jgi:hypothetical protein
MDDAEGLPTAFGTPDPRRSPASLSQTFARNLHSPEGSRLRSRPLQEKEEMMVSRLRRPFGFALAAGLALLLLPDPARAQAIIKVNDTVNFRVGFQLQGWAEWQQDQVSEGYQQSMFIRRVRFILGGNLAKNVSFFFQTDNPSLARSTGATSKDLVAGFRTQDAFMEWKPFSNDQFILDFGKMLMPFTRNSLQQTSSHLSWDGGTWTFQQSTALGTQSDGGRDIGLQFKSYLVNDHLEVRGGVFDGFRAAATPAGAGSRNSYRFVGRVVYNFLDPELKGYVPVGTWLGKKSILAIGGGVDTQSDYTAYGGDFMLDLPFGPGDAKVGRDALTAHVDYIHFDNGCGLNAAGTAHVTTCLIPSTTLSEQDEVFTDLGYFFHTINLQPFVRYEQLAFKESIDKSRGIKRYGGGFNYYVTPAAQQMKITVGYERIVPKTAPATVKTKDTNHFLVQLQIIYF